MNPLLDESEDRFILHPIRYPEVMKFGKDACQSFWTVEELDFTTDNVTWHTLEPQERVFIQEVLAFFAGADGIVVENLVTRFCAEVQLPEARYFYANQAFMESIHGEAYALLLQQFGGERLQDLLKATQESPPVAAKAEWAKKHFSIDEPDRERNFAKRLVAFACVEGICFSASFCAIFWVKHRGYQMHALTFSNELISRDEGMHRDFAVLLYHTFLSESLTHSEIIDIVKGAVEVEITWVEHTLPEKLIDMNKESMIQYVRFTADNLLDAFGIAPYYNVSNPFPFMVGLDLEGKTNFFERRVADYSLADKTEAFSLTEDF